MDPVTAAMNMVTQALKVYEKFYDSLTPEQRQQYNQPFLDGLTAINKAINELIEAVKKLN